MRIIKDVDFMEFVSNQQEAYIKPAFEFLDDAMLRIEQGVQQFGDPLPWQYTHDKMRFRPSEVTIWAGANGSGKSLVLGQAAAWWALDTPVVIASMEMKPEATLERMLKQTSGGSRPSREFANGFIAKTDFNLYIYDQLDTMDSDSILGMINYSATELGAKHIIIDSLMKCVKGTDDYNSQKNFVDALCWSAKRHDIHIHLVHHIRKSANETDEPDKYSIKGAGEITDLADNVILVYRNLLKERLRDQGSDKYKDEDVDCALRVVKQRHGEYEGRFGFAWHPDSQQWVSNKYRTPLPWSSLENMKQAVKRGDW